MYRHENFSRPVPVKIRVKKDAKGTHVTLWNPIVDADEQEIVAIVQRFFTVFHVSQVDGIGEYTLLRP